MSITPENAIGATTLLALGWIAFKRLLLRVAKDETGTVATEAERDIINMLRKEVARVVDSRNNLDAMVKKLHLEVVELRRENSSLRDTINALNERLNEMERHVS